MPGKVFVYNLTNDTIHNFSLNGMHTVGIAAPVDRTPQKIAIERTVNASDSAGKFINGQNNIIVIFSGGNGMITFRIDGSRFPLNQDLMLYIAQNKAFALSAWGEVIDIMDVRSGGFQTTGDGFVPNEVHQDANAPVN